MTVSECGTMKQIDVKNRKAEIAMTMKQKTIYGDTAGVACWTISNSVPNALLVVMWSVPYKSKSSFNSNRTLTLGIMVTDRTDIKCDSKLFKRMYSGNSDPEKKLNFKKKNFDPKEWHPEKLVYTNKADGLEDILIFGVMERCERLCIITIEFQEGGRAKII